MFSLKRKDFINVVKLYAICENKREFDFSFIKEIIKFIEATPSRYSLNYGKESEIGDIGKLENRMTFGRLEDFSVFDINGKTSLIFGKAGRAFSNSELFECMILNSIESKDVQFLKLVDLFSENFSLKYAYSRELRKDFLPVTEKGIKKGWFGSISAKVEKTESSWMLPPSEIETGAIKGIYPLNFWNDKVEERLEGLRFRFLKKDASIRVISFTDTEILEIKQKNPGYVKYIHRNGI